MRKRKRKITVDNCIAAWNRLNRKMIASYGIPLTSFDYPTLWALYPARYRALKRINAIGNAVEQKAA